MENPEKLATYGTQNNPEKLARYGTQDNPEKLARYGTQDNIPLVGYIASRFIYGVSESCITIQTYLHS
jgi:hypothetical protein